MGDFKETLKLLEEIKMEEKRIKALSRYLSSAYPESFLNEKSDAPRLAWGVGQEDPRALLMVKRIGGAAGRFVLYRRCAGKWKLTLLEPSPRQRKFLNNFMRDLMQRHKRWSAHALANRKRRDNAGAREWVHDFLRKPLALKKP